jgi:hypothetical protein
MKDLAIALENRPGALAEMGEALGRAGVSIEVLYSDHERRLILVVDDPVRARQVSDAWTGEHRP